MSARTDSDDKLDPSLVLHQSHFCCNAGVFKSRQNKNRNRQRKKHPPVSRFFGVLLLNDFEYDSYKCAFTVRLLSSLNKPSSFYLCSSALSLFFPPLPFLKEQKSHKMNAVLSEKCDFFLLLQVFRWGKRSGHENYGRDYAADDLNRSVSLFKLKISQRKNNCRAVSCIRRSHV